MRPLVKRGPAAASWALLLMLWPAPLLAQQPAVGSVTALAGEASVTHSAQPDPAPLQVADEVYLRDRIATNERSVVRVLLGGKATVTIRELSVLTITEDPARTSVDLQSGKIALRVNKALMKPGDAVEIYTPNAVLGVRGSLVVAEVAGTAAAPETHFTALEATLPITVASRGEPTKTSPLRLNERLSITGPRHAAKIGIARRLDRAQMSRERQADELPRHARRVAERHEGRRGRAPAARPSASSP